VLSLAAFFKNRREIERGFSVLELVVTVATMILVITVAIWSLKSHWETHAASAGKEQVINDLKVCSEYARSERQTYGIHFRSGRCENNPNTYSFLKVEPSGTVTEIPPLLGASGKDRIVTLPDKAVIYGLNPQTMGFDVDEMGARQMKVYFNPSGAIILCQYGDAEFGRYNFSDYASIVISDNAHGCSRTVNVFKLGDTSD
jgi:hypothetical protein